MDSDANEQRPGLQHPQHHHKCFLLHVWTISLPLYLVAGCQDFDAASPHCSLIAPRTPLRVKKQRIAGCVFVQERAVEISLSVFVLYLCLWGHLSNVQFENVVFLCLLFQRFRQLFASLLLMVHV
jgi:hypothetical protein